MVMTLTATARDIFGKKLKKERLAGRLPVVVYGNKKPAQSFFVSLHDFKKLLTQAGESTMFSLETPTGSLDTLIHEIAFQPVTGEPIHADFYLVDKTKTVTVKVPLRFDGVSPAVKDLGGTLVKVLHELEIEVLPAEIPHEILVDISLLTTLESQILVKNLVVPKGIKVLNEPETVVASIAVAKEEPVAEAPVDLTAIEVEKKGKKEEAEEPAENVSEIKKEEK